MKTMKNNSFAKYICIVLTVFVFIMLLSPFILAEMMSYSTTGISSFDILRDSIKDEMNKSKYDKILDDYLIDRFGDAIAKKMSTGTGSWRNFEEYTYLIKFDTLLNNGFNVRINKKNGVASDNIDDVLAKDDKFQHLYCEWVKKQIGCKDDNVELEFDLARDKHNSVHKRISIDFKSIVDVSNIEEEICRNTKNYMLYSIDKKKLDKNNKSNFLDEAKKIKENFYNDIISNNCQDILWENINIKLYYYDVDLAFDRYNNSLVNSNEDNFYYVRFGLKDNTIKYISDTFDCMYSGLILSNWFTQVE